MSTFSGRHYPKDVILWAVRWYCRYGVSYRDLEEMLTERGVPVDHTTVCRGCSATHPRWISTPVGIAGSASGQRNRGGSMNLHPDWWEGVLPVPGGHLPRRHPGL